MAATGWVELAWVGCGVTEMEFGTVVFVDGYFT